MSLLIGMPLNEKGWQSIFSHQLSWQHFILQNYMFHKLEPKHTSLGGMVSNLHSILRHVHKLPEGSTTKLALGKNSMSVNTSPDFILNDFLLDGVFISNPQWYSHLSIDRSSSSTLLLSDPCSMSEPSCLITNQPSNKVAMYSLILIQRSPHSNISTMIYPKFETIALVAVRTLSLLSNPSLCAGQSSCESGCRKKYFKIFLPP